MTATKTPKLMPSEHEETFSGVLHLSKHRHDKAGHRAKSEVRLGRAVEKAFHEGKSEERREETPPQKEEPAGVACKLS